MFRKWSNAVPVSLASMRSLPRPPPQISLGFRSLGDPLPATTDPTLKRLEVELEKYVVNPGVHGYSLSSGAVYGVKEGLDIIPKYIHGIRITKHLVLEDELTMPKTPRDLPDMAHLWCSPDIVGVGRSQTHIEIFAYPQALAYIQKTHLGIPIHVQEVITTYGCASPSYQALPESVQKSKH